MGLPSSVECPVDCAMICPAAMGSVVDNCGGDKGASVAEFVVCTRALGGKIDVILKSNAVVGGNGFDRTMGAMGFVGLEGDA